MSKPDPFEYVQGAYGEHIKKGARVKNTCKSSKQFGTTGTIATAKGQYIHILWDGDLKPMGPYHPTSDLEYLSA